MMTINCTKKLTKRLPFAVVADPRPSTNKLGPWCANSFNIGRFPMILVTNERTFLSVVIPFKDIHSLHARFLWALEVLLQSIAVSSSDILAELEQMDIMQLTDKTNRSAVGTMNDFVFHAKGALYDNQDLSLEELSFNLSGIPCAPLKYGLPREEVLNVIALPHNRHLQIHRN